ncbi:MAG TPA: asparagine synthase (glutamine-hydrolyzing) [Acidimicrobiales bacterium]|nr:asparagine synthase (glutamine-hydrolyzing) [Acidimicrobiales bacterium]
MCGIAGVVGGPRGGDEHLVRDMCSTMRHRGPDDQGTMAEGDVALGMRRLAIVGVESGAQPMSSPDGRYTIVFNGEIYNFRELQSSLAAAGHTLRTASDTECILHLYEDMGRSCVGELRGMFAFALWDRQLRRLFLARDRAGKKPLFYRHAGGSLSFASELKALVRDPTFSRSVDPLALHHYLTLQYVPAPLSIYQGIKKLPPAHTLTYEEGEAAIERYWSLDYRSKLAVTDDEAAEMVRDKVREATRIRMYSERPLGAFLSGGVDSSLVVAAMAEASSLPVKTFTVGFRDEQFDERPYARMVAERFATDHHEYVVDETVADLLPTLAWYYDEPFADSSAVPTYYVSEMTARQVTVALNGDGGDESFAGYDRYRAMELGRRLSVPAGMAGGVRRLASLAERPAAGRAGRRAGRFLEMLAAPPTDRYGQLMSYFTPDQKLDLYSGAMRQQVGACDTYDLIRDVFERSSASDLTDRLLDVDVNTYLPGDLLVKVDMASMANSLEARSPLLDHEVMELAARLPPRLKLRGRTSKVALKLAARGWLPDQVIDRPKRGFGVPLADWLRQDLAEMTRDLLTDATARQRGYFEPAAVQRLIDEHQASGGHGPRLWALLMLELWHRTWLDPAVPDPTPPCP